MRKRKRIGVDDRIPLSLSAADRDLVLEHTFLDLDLMRRLELAEVSGKSLIVRYTLTDLDQLLGHIAAAANHADNKKLQRRLDRLYDHLKDYEDRYEDELSAPWP